MLTILREYKLYLLTALLTKFGKLYINSKIWNGWQPQLFVYLFIYLFTNTHSKFHSATGTTDRWMYRSYVCPYLH